MSYYYRDVNGKRHALNPYTNIDGLIIKGQKFHYGQHIAPADFICGWTSKTIKKGKPLFCSTAITFDDRVYSSLSALKQAIIAKKGL